MYFCCISSSCALLRHQATSVCCTQTSLWMSRGPSPKSVLGDMEYDVIDAVLEQNISEKRQAEDDMNDPRFA